MNRTPPSLALVLASLIALALGTACGGAETRGDAEEPETDDRIETGDDRPMSRRTVSPDMDDEEDDSFAISGVGGRLEVYDIQESIKPRARDLERCYTGKVGRKRYLGGDIELAYVVDRDGSVKSVRLQRSDLGAWEIEKCLLDVAASIEFPEPQGNGEADFTVPMSFPATRSVHWWDEERAVTETEELIEDLGECENRPDDVWITFYVGSQGKVLSAGFASESKEGVDSEWAECAAGVVTAWKVSDPRGKIAKTGFRWTP